MANNQRFDDSIGRWLEETAPNRLPQRVLATIFERTRRTPQNPAWRTVLRRPQMPRFIPALGSAAVLVMAAALASNIGLISLPGGTPTPPVSPSNSPRPTAPPIETEIAELLNGFLDARVAGQGAEQHLDNPEAEVEIPLLYATSSGAPYERAEFEQVLGYEWPYGFIAFKVRLFGGNTVVEQLFFTPHNLALYPDPSRRAETRPWLEYVPDGFGTDIAPTIEAGQPVARPYNAFEGEVTLHVAHPWVFRYDTTTIRLIPEGQFVGPTTDGGERNDWDRLVLMADPARSGTSCPTGPGPADAEALAESIRSDPDLEVTAPAAMSAGGAEGLMMDVVIATEDFWVCGGLRGETELQVEEHVALAAGDRMRLYLFDVPEGSSMRTLGVAMIVPESRFENAVDAAAPVVEFHAP